MVLGGFLSLIFHTYNLNHLLLETEMNVELRQYLVLIELLRYIVILISAALVLYSF